MSGTTDKISGIANEATGKAKQGVGSVVGSEKLKNEGAAQEVKGDAQRAVGDAKNAVKDGANKAANAINKSMTASQPFDRKEPPGRGGFFLPESHGTPAGCMPALAAAHGGGTSVPCPLVKLQAHEKRNRLSCRALALVPRFRKRGWALTDAAIESRDRAENGRAEDACGGRRAAYSISRWPKRFASSAYPSSRRRQPMRLGNI